MALAAAALGGCLERKLSITSDPAGAVVYVNDVEIGRTPVEADFTFYGTFDLRVEKDGFEPLRARTPVRAPVYEYPPFDLVATALPVRIENNVKRHYVLTPARTLDAPTAAADEEALLERARALRARSDATVQAK